MENNFAINLAQIEIAHLDLKYSHTRIRNITGAARMSDSMERFRNPTNAISAFMRLIASLQ